MAERAGCSYSALVQRAADIDWAALGHPKTVGLTAGASAPEILVDEVIAAFRERFDVTLEMAETVREDVQFKLPRALRSE